MKPKLLIVTGSPFKFQDLVFKLREYFDCEQRDWDQPEIQGDPEEIILHKLKTAYELFKQPVLVDDVSVHLEALNGFPGPYMKDFWKHFNPQEMGNKFAGSKIKAVCRLGLCRGPEDVLIVQDEFNGEIIVPKNNDHQGRFFELFVKLEGDDKVMLDYTDEERNKKSHRGKAMEKLLSILRDNK